jgi:hypothetical protein
MTALLPNIFVKPDGGSARSARPRLTNAIMADRAAVAAAEIAALRQKLAAAEARIRKIEDKDNTLKPLRERIAAFNCKIAKWWSGS